MRNLLITSLLLCACIGLSAQTGYNLQFKSVKNYSLSGACLGSGNSGVVVATLPITVAANTVLKIESATVNSIQNTTRIIYNQAGLSIDNYMLRQYTYQNSSNTSLPYESKFPLWLPAGDYTLKLYDSSMGGQSTSVTLYGLVTGIEFNLITP